MKRIIYFWISLVILAGCKKDSFEPGPGERPEERMKVALDELRSTLVGAPYGWKGFLAPEGGGGYGFFIEFLDDDRVRMVSDINSETAGNVEESTYRVKAVMAPSVLFDTYSYLHMLADPTPTTLGGVAGVGLASDFEFELINLSSDSLLFLGKKRRSGFYLVRASAEERSQYLDGTFRDRVGEFKLLHQSLKNPYLHLSGGNRAQVAIDVEGRKLTLNEVSDAGTVEKSTEVPFAYTLTGIELLDDLPYGNQHLQRFQLSQDKMFAEYGGGQIEVLESPVPLLSLDQLFGWGKPYVKLQGTSVPGISSGIHLYDQVVALFTSSARTVNNIDFSLTTSLQAKITINYVANSSGSAFVADATFSYKIEGDIITLTRTAVNVNWPTRETQVAPFNQFFGEGDTRQFRIDWGVSNDPTVTYPIGGLYPLNGNSNDYFYGRL